ncbi:MAG: 3-oxoacyl-[acyl-carrier-protein] synthase [Thermodesulfobacteriota bacterium]|nr:3-oxoacyl-[acyl-carrier-protein] synthase [Thermodesulfobacteriota bacterium]
MKRRVAVTGLGIISPCGDNIHDLSVNLMAGKSGVRRISSSYASLLSVKIAAEVDFNPFNYFTKRQVSTMDRVNQFALAAAAQAWKDSEPSLDAKEKERAGVYIGSGMGGGNTIENLYDQLFKHNADRVKPLTVLMVMNNATASHISIEYGLSGPCLTLSTACASSANAIGEAFRQIRDGYVDVMLAGGAEAFLTYGGFRSWESLRVLAVEDPEDPSKSCKPFSKNRTGLVLGEGAAMVVLEEMERAVRRGAPIYAEVIGYGSTSDAGHIAKPSLEGQARAMAEALKEAGLLPEDVDYINAHGTATRWNDLLETQAIKKVFNDYACKVPISSTKSMHGHTMGASGAIEFIVSLLAIKNQAVPPTINLDQPDPECDLDYIPNIGRRGVKVNTVMSNSFAFGGTNAVLVARKMEE